MRILSCLLLLQLSGGLTLTAQLNFIPEKVDSNLWHNVETGASSDFLVILKEQADLSGAARFRRKADKGRYVYETLLEIAERTQPPVRAVLRAAEAPMNSFWIINGLASYGNADLVLRLAGMPEVDRVEDNPVWHLSLPPQDVAEPATDRTLTPASWGLTKINADDVWTLGHTGAGVVVGGQDTGYEWQHPALKDKYRGWDGSSANHNYNWHDAIHALIAGGSNSCGLNLMAPCDDDGHGTHTMGTMAGSSSMSNVVGVAPDAQWIGCRNMEEGDGMPSTYIECFQWLAAPTDLNNANADPAMAPAVINNSWGCPTSEGCNGSNFATMEAVIASVQAAGVLVVTSAGNSGSSCSTVNDPPSIFSVSFAVGATQNFTNDLIAGFSSRGPVTVYGSGTLKKPNVAAPGVGINSCVGNSNNGGTYGYSTLSGTSMAGPHVAGLAALVMSARPDLIGQVDILKSIIQSTCVPRFASSPFCGGDNSSTLPNNVYGWGRVDALAAVNAAIALPVELLYLKAEARGNTVVLQWATATESNCARFEVQRSPDGVHWLPLGYRPCSAFSTGLREYDFTDAQPAAGVNYYRLKQEDLSGAYLYTEIVSVRFGDTGISLRAIPHRSAQQLYVELTGASTGEHWQVSVLGAEGREIRSAGIENLLLLDLPPLPAGVYLVALRDERGRVLRVEKVLW